MSFSDLYNEHYGFLYFWVLKEIRNNEMAEDVCATSFAKAFESFFELQDPAKFKPWLFTIASNEIKTYFKRSKIRATVPLDDCEEPRDPRDFIGEMENYYEMKRVQNALQLMSITHRQAVKRYVSGKACQRTWGSRLYHAKRELRHLISI